LTAISLVKRRLSDEEVCFTSFLHVIYRINEGCTDLALDKLFLNGVCLLQRFYHLLKRWGKTYHQQIFFQYIVDDDHLPVLLQSLYIQNQSMLLYTTFQSPLVSFH